MRVCFCKVVNPRYASTRINSSEQLSRTPNLGEYSKFTSV